MGRQTDFVRRVTTNHKMEELASGTAQVVPTTILISGDSKHAQIEIFQGRDCFWLLFLDREMKNV